LKSQNKVRESKQPQDSNEKNAQTQPGQIKQYVSLNYMHTLKPQILLHKYQGLTQSQRQLTIILTPKKKSLSDKCNFPRGEASEIA